MRFNTRDESNINIFCEMIITAVIMHKKKESLTSRVRMGQSFKKLKKRQNMRNMKRILSAKESPARGVTRTVRCDQQFLATIGGTLPQHCQE